MYAIIKTGGKQYRVQKGDVIDVELLDMTNGNLVEFKEVLFVGDQTSAKVGMPHVAGCVVKGELLGISRGPKVKSLKFKPSHNSHCRRFGHRQSYSQVRITEITS